MIGSNLPQEPGSDGEGMDRKESGATAQGERTRDMTSLGQARAKGGKGPPLKKLDDLVGLPMAPALHLVPLPLELRGGRHRLAAEDPGDGSSLHQNRHPTLRTVGSCCTSMHQWLFPSGINKAPLRLYDIHLWAVMLMHIWKVTYNEMQFHGLSALAVDLRISGLRIAHGRWRPACVPVLASTGPRVHV